MIKVRNTLLSNSKLLKILGDFIAVDGPALPKNKIVIAAPHEAPSGTPLSDGHDVNTGALAKLLSKQLAAKSVVVSELRTFVDINKDPFVSESAALAGNPGKKAFMQADKLLKLYYQSQIFQGMPDIIIEVHGHETGKYDIEVSTGFSLNKNVEQDKVLVNALQIFKSTLEKALSESSVFSKKLPAVGVYPLDSDVKFTAGGTHTFNKIEKLRELGVPISGLHIEIHKKLRPKLTNSRSTDLYSALSDCLMKGIQEFLSSLNNNTEFDFKEYLFTNFAFDRGYEPILIDETPFVVQQIPREFVNVHAAVLNSSDKKKYDLKDNESLMLSRDESFEESLDLKAAESDRIKKGYIGISQKDRKKLNIRLGEDVYVGKIGFQKIQDLILGFIAHIDKSIAKTEVIVRNDLYSEIKDKGLEKKSLWLNSSTGEELEIKVKSHKSLPHKHSIAVSEALAEELNVTFGDLVCFSGAYNNFDKKFNPVGIE